LWVATSLTIPRIPRVEFDEPSVPRGDGFAEVTINEKDERCWDPTIPYCD
jgi:hypothetical protein